MAGDNNIETHRQQPRIGYPADGYKDYLLFCDGEAPLPPQEPEKPAADADAETIKQYKAAYGKYLEAKKAYPEQLAAFPKTCQLADRKLNPDEDIQAVVDYAHLVMPSKDNIFIPGKLGDSGRLVQENGFSIMRYSATSMHCSTLQLLRGYNKKPSGDELEVSELEMRDLNAYGGQWRFGASCVEDDSHDQNQRTVPVNHRTSWTLSGVSGAAGRDQVSEALQQIRAIKNGEQEGVLEAEWPEARLTTLEQKIERLTEHSQDGLTNLLSDPVGLAVHVTLGGAGFAAGMDIYNSSKQGISNRYTKIKAGAKEGIKKAISRIKGGGGPKGPTGGAGTGGGAGSTGSAEASSSNSTVQQMTATATTAAAGLWASAKASVGSFIDDNKETILAVAGTAAAIGVGASVISAVLAGDDTTGVLIADDVGLIGTVPVAAAGLLVAGGLYSLVGEEFNAMDEVSAATDNIL